MTMTASSRVGKILICSSPADLRKQSAFVFVLVLFSTHSEPDFWEAFLMAPCSFKRSVKGLVKATRSPCRQKPAPSAARLNQANKRILASRFVALPSKYAELRFSNKTWRF